MLLKDCMGVYQAFQKLSDMNLPLKSSWMIAQNLTKLQPIIESFEEARQKYIAQLRTQAEVDESGNAIVTDELADAFRIQVEELLNEDQKVRLKKVTLIDNGQLSIEPAILLAAMDYLILEDHGNKAS